MTAGTPEGLREALEDAVRAAVAEAAKCRTKPPCQVCGYRVAEVMKAADAYAGAAGAKVTEARQGLRNFLGQYGASDIPMFKVGQDLANATLKILGGAPGPEDAKAPQGTEAPDAP